MAADSPVQLEDAVSLKNGKESAHQQMLDVCKRALPGWGQLTVADVQFTTVSGGISNVNAKLSPKAELGLEPVMFKVFGDKTEQIIDRDAEKVVVVALGQQGFGPKVLALFANGRIEQWLDCICLNPADMSDPQLVPRIARHLRRFHSIQVDLPREPHTPWGVIRDWLQQAQQLTFKDPVKQAAYEAIDFKQLEAEVAETEQACALTACPLVFGHNDLLSGNILLLQRPGFDPATPDREGRVVFIDYEYGAYTYRDFDIGNHFTEYAGFDGDYDRYPNKQQQELFFRHYMAEDAAMQQHKQQQQQQQSQPAKRGPFAWLQRLRRHKHSRQQQQPSPSAAAPQQEQRQLHRLGSMEVPTGSSSSSSSSLPPLAPATLDELSASANVWALASHLYWGIWAIIQACYSPIDFDYLQFHRTRLGEYRRRKQAFHAEARRVFGGQQRATGSSSSSAQQQQQPGGGSSDSTAQGAAAAQPTAGAGQGAAVPAPVPA